ncbi:MAG: BTAD domain-containing putative transcriptional regulator, partial [Gemmatimonadaceae bacterium]
MVRFRLFGSIDLHDQNGSELRSVLAQPKRLALLAYLCITRELGPSRRDTIVGLFWPELDQDRARKALNKAVHFLRQELGDDVLASRSAEELAVDAEQLWCDVSGFNAAVKADDHATATELYRGDLLTGVFLEAGHEFDQWLDGERVRLRLAAARAARLLAQQHEQQGSLTLAVDMARRAVELSDGDERLFRELLALHDRVGDRAGAVRAYDAFAEQLAREYQTEPAPETQALIGRIRGRTEARATAAELDFRPADEPRTASDESSVPSLVRPLRRRLPAYPAIAAVLLLVGMPLTWWVMSKGTEVSPIQSLVVLPLDNLTADSAQEYFAQGMHEALIASLAQLSGRRIISRTSAMNYKGTTKSVPEIARELGVDAVIEGSVFRAGDSVRVQVQLIAARPERHIWTETYNRSLSDILALHSEIAGTVAHQVTASMSDTAQQPLERARSPQHPKVVNLEAYDEFLRGQYHLARAPSTL